MIGVEFVPSDDFFDDVKVLKAFHAIVNYDFVLIPDNPFNHPSTCSVLCAKMLQDALNLAVYPCISGGGKSLEGVKSLIEGAKYAGIEGVACVSGDTKGVGVREILEESRGFRVVLSTSLNWEEKKRWGATYGIMQPIFSLDQLPQKGGEILPNFMPIFRSQTFKSLHPLILGLIPSDYMEHFLQSNVILWEALKERDFYLTPLNLKKQMPFFRNLVHSSPLHSCI